jgi:hypothetical protein
MFMVKINKKRDNWTNYSKKKVNFFSSFVLFDFIRIFKLD